MTRVIGSSTLTALESNTSSATPIYFIELLIDTGSPEEILRIHNGLGTITWNSVDWTGAGDLLSFDGVEESSSINPAPFRCSLAATSEILNITLATNYYRRPCLVYLGGLSAGALVEDPSTIFSGFIESIDMVMGGEQGDSVTLTAESEFILFRRSRNLRYTDRQLQSEYSGDLGMEYMESTATGNVVWRGQRNQLGGSAGDGGVQIIGGGVVVVGDAIIG